MQLLKRDPLFSNTLNLSSWIVWIHCICFVVLYAVWILPEIVAFRNTPLVLGAIVSFYPIYRFRHQLLSKRAFSIWLIAGLFIWSIFHLSFLSHNNALQLMELKRIWKYAFLAAIFALGFGLSLTNNALPKYWRIIHFGLATPILIYLLKYLLTIFSGRLGFDIPLSFQVNNSAFQLFYIPKTDYVAFCLPTFAISLGEISVIFSKEKTINRKIFEQLSINCLLAISILFLFYVQNIKNGFAYVLIIFCMFAIKFIFSRSATISLFKLVIAVCLACIFTLAISLNLRQNSSWSSLVADAKIAYQTEDYQQWKYAGAHGYPNNELGRMVSETNYDRVAWAKVGLELAIENPLGYGLIEDSFKYLAKNKWPEVSPNLSHSHSGWLDLILAIGFPGFFLVMGALLFTLLHAKQILGPYKNMVFWGLSSNLLLWCTTEVCATVTFAALIFWIVWSSALYVGSHTSVEHAL